MEPSNEVLALFNARLVAPLGGRVNQHWLVESQAKQFVLRRWGQPPWLDETLLLNESINYEVLLVGYLDALGWPVAPPNAGPVRIAGQIWSLAPFLPGEVPVMDGEVHGSREEQRKRGRLLAEFHAGLTLVPELGQRPGWRRCEEILADLALDKILSQNEQERSEEVAILRRHLEQARKSVTDLRLPDRLGMVVHGDFTPWNLRFTNGRLSGILDFELSHWDHRVADFALSWRGKYDEVVLGYNEVSPLEPEEWELLTPLWWSELIRLACADMKAGVRDDGWILTKLLVRTPLMGRNVAAYQA